MPAFALFWIVHHDGDDRHVMLARSASLGHAQLAARIARLPGQYAEGHVLDAKRERRVPKALVGRPLSGAEVERLLDRLSAK